MRKLEFVALTEQLLNVSAISFAQNLTTCHSDAKQLMADFKDQLLHYRKVNSECTSGNAFGMPKVTYSGKVSEDGKLMPYNMQDDLCITLQLAVFWSMYVLEHRCIFLDYTRIYA